VDKEEKMGPSEDLRLARLLNILHEVVGDINSSPSTGRIDWLLPP